MLKNKYPADVQPVVVGGVGGSGTRVIAKMLVNLGYYVGDDLNDALDSLWFVLLFNYPDILDIASDEFDGLLDLFVKAMLLNENFSIEEKKLLCGLAVVDRGQFSGRWLQERKDSLLNLDCSSRRVGVQGRWGWKVPTAHIVLDRLIESGLKFKYIHVMRNGLDMAYSNNQNQLKFWGEIFLGRKPEITPRDSLKYWHIVHHRVTQLGEKLGDNFYLLNFDQLCAFPDPEVDRLQQFLSIEDDSVVKQLSGLVHVPRSVGRYKKCSLDDFDSRDVEFVKSMGFSVEK